MLSDQEKTKLFEDIGYIKGKIDSLPCSPNGKRIGNLETKLADFRESSTNGMWRNMLGLVSKGLTFINALAIIVISVLIYSSNL